jgi:hypothetical protein
MVGPNGQVQASGTTTWKIENGRLQVIGPNGQVEDFGQVGGDAAKKALESFRRDPRSGRAGGSPDPRRPMIGPVDPETRALEEKEQKIADDVQKIVDQYKSATDKAERAKLKKQLEELSGQQFDVRQQRRELEVKRLETELARIHESIQKRNENREKIIDRRILQLLEEDDDWGVPASKERDDRGGVFQFESGGGGGSSGSGVF